jgi:hypothetical protein
VHWIANRTARHAVLVKSLPVFNIIVIDVALSFSSEPSMYSQFCLVSIVQLIYAVSLFINILGLGEYLPALEGLSLRRKILGELSAPLPNHVTSVLPVIRPESSGF